MKNCLYCQKEISNNKKYCNNQCQRDYEYKKYIEAWKSGKDVSIGNWGQLSRYIKRYLFDKYNNSCSRCGWSKINPYTQTIPLEVEHKDGNYLNNNEDNLDLLCPNCHSLTPAYRGANRGNGRNITWIRK